MDKITYLRKTKEKINEEYLEKLHGIDEIFKSENVQIAIYVGKNIICNNLWPSVFGLWLVMLNNKIYKNDTKNHNNPISLKNSSSSLAAA